LFDSNIDNINKEY